MYPSLHDQYHIDEGTTLPEPWRIIEVHSYEGGLAVWFYYPHQTEADQVWVRGKKTLMEAIQTFRGILSEREAA
jgi:hypothetical protein